jgi:hypothetical protein
MPKNLLGMASARYESEDYGEAIQMLDHILISYGDWRQDPRTPK